MWKYFGFISSTSGKIEDKRKVFCKLCDPPFALSYVTNTSNLTYHLERKHPEEHRKVLSAQGKKNQVPSKALSKATPFLSISDSNRGSIKPYNKTSKQAKQLVNATAEFISLSLQPELLMNQVSETCFPQQILVLNLPHRTHFSTKVSTIEFMDKYKLS